MGNFLKSSRRRLRAGWFWPLVLLALPNCQALLGLGGKTWDGGPADPGPESRTSAVMCYIPKAKPTCALATDIGISTTAAAVALATDQHAGLVFDFSPNDVCDAGVPLKTEVYGTFPDGYQACLNCGTQIPAKYADGNAFCAAQCKDLLTADNIQPGQDVGLFCDENAHVATNFDPAKCYDNICSTGGQPLPFVDQRRDDEPAAWIINPADGTAPAGNGNGLTMNADETQPATFSAGSAAKQVITYGDGWVEFEAGDDPTTSNLSHVLGVSTCSQPCDKDNPPLDLDRTPADIDWAISLNSDKLVYVLQNGTVVGGPFDAYQKGERFRVNFVDKHDGGATIDFRRSCVKNTLCDQNANEFAPMLSGFAPYPLRIDTSFREKDAILGDVTIVRIKED